MSELAGHSAVRTLSVLFGAPLAAAALSCFGARATAATPSWSTAIGYHSFVPLWVALVCVLPLSRSGARGWMWCGLLCLPLLFTL